jgi:hypothetical protein
MKVNEKKVQEDDDFQLSIIDFLLSGLIEK